MWAAKAASELTPLVGTDIRFIPITVDCKGQKGAAWVAVRIPDNAIAGHANQARITTLPVSFRRVFEADADATFLELHEAILKSVGYPDDQMTSFFLCNDEWEKGQEVTLVEMDSNFEYDNMVMNETRLSDLIEDVGQRLIYVFDPMFERYFFGSLKEIKPG